MPVVAGAGGEVGAEGTPGGVQTGRTDTDNGERVIVREGRAVLFNCRGLQGKLTENDFRREYIELRDGFYHIAGLAEP